MRKQKTTARVQVRVPVQVQVLSGEFNVLQRSTIEALGW